MRETYSAVVESGSCSMDYRRWEERLHCGHHHRTFEAAVKCGEKRRNARYENGSFVCSAAWYNFTIHNQHNERIIAIHNQNGERII